jgi:hypothetical protein
VCLQFASAAAQQVMVVALTVASLLFISASLINIADVRTHHDACRLIEAPLL